MADKTTGGLPAVEEASIGSLPGIADLYDDSLLPVEQQGEARHMTGRQWKRYAQAGVAQYVEDAKDAADKALEAVNKVAPPWRTPGPARRTRKNPLRARSSTAESRR